MASGMPRDHRRGAARIRGSWTLRIAGTALVVLAAAAATSVLLLAHSKVEARKDSPPSLSGKVVTALTVGLVNPGPTTNLNPVPERRMMQFAGGLLSFKAVLSTAQAAALEQWTSNKMSDGTYIFIYAPNGLCLTASPQTLSLVTLSQCTLGISQRWQHKFLGLMTNGRYYWRLSSVLNGRCLADSGTPLSGQAEQFVADLQPCSAAKPREQIIRTNTAY
jgi:hypothetical protein